MQGSRTFTEAEQPTQTLMHRLADALLGLPKVTSVQTESGAKATVYGFGQYEYYGCLAEAAHFKPAVEAP